MTSLFTGLMQCEMQLNLLKQPNSYAYRVDGLSLIHVLVTAESLYICSNVLFAEKLVVTVMTL
jgi:hypothetical protein